MVDRVIAGVVALSLQANGCQRPASTHVTCLVCLAWPASALRSSVPASVPNKDPPTRFDTDHFPEAEIKGQISLWAKPNSLLWGDPEGGMPTLGGVSGRRQWVMSVYDKERHLRQIRFQKSESHNGWDQ